VVLAPEPTIRLVLPPDLAALQALASDEATTLVLPSYPPYLPSDPSISMSVDAEDSITAIRDPEDSITAVRDREDSITTVRDPEDAFFAQGTEAAARLQVEATEEVWTAPTRRPAPSREVLVRRGRLRGLVAVVVGAVALLAGPIVEKALGLSPHDGWAALVHGATASLTPVAPPRNEPPGSSRPVQPQGADRATRLPGESR
jgi:hypothetical protein